MNTERALEIINAYGADARRWPDDERGGVLALVANDASVAVALAEARGLDGLLAGWARDVLPREYDAGAIMAGASAAAPMVEARSSVRRWFAGSAVAAAVALAIVMTSPQAVVTPVPVEIAENSPVPSATVEGDGSSSDAEQFALLFTPTVDEDELI